LARISGRALRTIARPSGITHRRAASHPGASNAIKFTDAGEVRVTAEAINGHFAVSVADTGPGIPEQERMRIFEQFHQVDNSNMRATGQLASNRLGPSVQGLGLARGLGPALF